MIGLQSVLEKAWDIFVHQELPIIWKPFEPYVIGALIGIFVVGFFKLFWRKIVRFISLMSGDTKRETKRKEKRVCDIVDLFSSLKDIFSAFSKH